MKKNTTIFCIIFLLLSTVLMLQIPTNDFIWGYGFSYNISQGLIPYKDFNMIVSPIYNLLFSIPMLIFGNHVLPFILFHTFFYSLILTMAYQKIGKKVLWIILLFLPQNTAFGYNTFITTLILLIILIIGSKTKNKNLLIGLIIGFITMTKHNVGLILIFVYFLTSKKKIHSMLYISIFIIITFSYLILTNSFMDYINICFLGMKNFCTNFHIDKFTLILALILLYYLTKRYIKTKDIKILYLLASSIILFPLIEINHLLTILIPITYYILENEKNIIINKITIIFIIILETTYLITTYSNKIPKLEKENNLFLYTIVTDEITNYLKNYSEYIHTIDGNLYLFINNAYLIKLYNNETTNFYDLINKGNLGQNENKYINEIKEKCKKEKCTFILDNTFYQKESKTNQLSINFKKFVLNNYKYIETLPSNDRVYTNNIEK